MGEEEEGNTANGIDHDSLWQERPSPRAYSVQQYRLRKFLHRRFLLVLER